MEWEIDCSLASRPADTARFRSAQPSSRTQNREFMFKLFAKSANSQRTYSPVLLGRMLLSTGQNSDKTCADNVTAYTIPNQSLRLFPDHLWPARTDVALFSRYQSLGSFVCWEHIAFEEALPTKLDCKHFLLLSEGFYYSEFSVLPWSASNLYPVVMLGKWDTSWSFRCNFRSKI